MIALLFALATAVAGEIPLTPSDVTAQTDPAVAADTTQAVVVWSEANQVRLARVEFDGTLPDGAGLIVSPSSRSQSMPRIAFDGTNYLVIWAEEGNVRGRFFTPSGAFAGNAFAIYDGVPVQGAPAVASLPAELLVAWSGGGEGAAAVNSAGLVTPLDVFRNHGTATGEVALAAAADGALIAFDERFGLPSVGGPQTTLIETIRLRGYTVTNQSMIATKTTGIGGATQIFLRNPRVAATPGGFLIGWTQQNGPGRGSGAYVATLDDSGARTSEPLQAGTSFGSADFPPARVVPFFDGAQRGIVTVDYPLLEIALFNGGVTGKRRISQANTSTPPSFTHFDAVVIGPNKVAVAYELGLSTPTPRTRIYVSVVEVAPQRRHAAGR
jgi:hypothetical protein